MTEGMDPAHAERHYGKYSAGYNRGYARGREERWQLIQRLHNCMKFLRELDDLNRQCGDDLLPSELAAQLREFIQ